MLKYIYRHADEVKIIDEHWITCKRVHVSIGKYKQTLIFIFSDKSAHL